MLSLSFYVPNENPPLCRQANGVDELDSFFKIKNRHRMKSSINVTYLDTTTFHTAHTFSHDP